MLQLYPHGIADIGKRHVAHEGYGLESLTIRLGPVGELSQNLARRRTFAECRIGGEHRQLIVIADLDAEGKEAAALDEEVPCGI